MFTFRSEITVVPGKMPEMVEAWQQFIKGSKFPCRLYAAVTGRFNVVAVEADMEHLSDLEPWAATWPKRLMHILAEVERIGRFEYEYGNPLAEVLPWNSISKPS